MPNELLDNTDATDCAGVLGNVRLAPMYFGGHCYYCAKCIRGKVTDGDFNKRNVEGIVLPDVYWKGEQRINCADRTNWLTILAVGPAVGKRCSKMHAWKYSRPRHIADELRPGDTIFIAGDDRSGTSDIGIMVSPLCDYEFFIEEGLPCLVERKQEVQT